MATQLIGDAKLHLYQNTIYVCDVDSSEPRRALAFDGLNEQTSIIACIQSPTRIALARANQSITLLSYQDIIDRMHSVSVPIVSVVEGSTSLQIVDPLSKQLRKELPFDLQTVPIEATLHDEASPSFSFDGRLLATKVHADTIVSGKRVVMEKVKITHFTGVGERQSLELPDAYQSASSFAFSRASPDGSRYLLAIRAQRPQDPTSYIYLFAIKLTGTTGEITLQSKHRLSVVAPVCVAFSPAQDVFITCGPRANVFAFCWTEALTLGDPVDVPFVCPLRSPVFSPDGQCIAAFQFGQSENQLVILKRISSGDFMLHSSCIIPSPGESVLFHSNCSSVVVQTKFGVLLRRQSISTLTSARLDDIFLASFYFREKEKLLFSRVENSNDDLKAYLEFMLAHELDMNRHLEKLKKLLELDSNHATALLQAIDDLCNNYAVVRDWNVSFWSQLQVYFESLNACDETETIFPQIARAESTGHLRLTTTLIPSIAKSSNPSDAFHSFLHRSLMPSPDYLPMLASCARKNFTMKGIRELAQVPSEFTLPSVYTMTIPSIVRAVLESIVTDGVTQFPYVNLREAALTPEVLHATLYVAAPGSTAWSTVFHQLPGSGIDHISAAVSALLIVCRHLPQAWRALFWDAWLATYSTLLIQLTVPESTIVYPHCWPVAAFHAESLILPGTITALLLGTSAFDTSGKFSTGIGFHSREESTPAIKGMKKYGFNCDGGNPSRLITNLGIVPLNMIRVTPSETQLCDRSSQGAWLPYSLKLVDFITNQSPSSEEEALSVSTLTIASSDVPIAVFWQETSDINSLLTHLVSASENSVFFNNKIKALPPPNEFYAQAQLLATLPKVSKEESVSAASTPRKSSMKSGASTPPRSGTSTPARSGANSPVKSPSRSASFSRSRSIDGGKSPEKPVKPSEKAHPLQFIRNMVSTVISKRGSDKDLLPQPF